MMRSSAYNRFGVLMGTSARASCPRWLNLRGDALPMRTLIASQGDFCATADEGFLKVEDDSAVINDLNALQLVMKRFSMHSFVVFVGPFDVCHGESMAVVKFEAWAQAEGRPGEVG